MGSFKYFTCTCTCLGVRRWLENSEAQWQKQDFLEGHNSPAPPVASNVLTASVHAVSQALIQSVLYSIYQFATTKTSLLESSELCVEQLVTKCKEGRFLRVQSTHQKEQNHSCPLRLFGVLHWSSCCQGLFLMALVSGTKRGKSELVGIEQKGTCLLEMCQVFFEKENVKSVRNMVFTSQRNTTQKCRLIFEI